MAVHKPLRALQIASVTTSGLIDAIPYLQCSHYTPKTIVPVTIQHNYHVMLLRYATPASMFCNLNSKHLASQH